MIFQLIKYSGNQKFWPKFVSLNILVIPKALTSVFSTFTKIQEIEMSAWQHTVLCEYFQNPCENGKYKAMLSSKIFDFTYWGTFSARNSEVFVQENFFSEFEKINFGKFLFK